MSIHKTKEGTYRVRWRERGRMKSKTFTRRIDADQFEAKLKLGQLPSAQAAAEGESLTFSEYQAIWLRDHAAVHKAQSSQVRDHQIIRTYLMPRFERLKLAAITERDSIQLQSSLKAEGRISDKTINNVTGTFHKMLSDAVRWGYLKLNPCRAVRPIKVPAQDYRFWTFEERDRFLSYAKANDEDLYRLVAVAVYTGLRRGELEGLLRDCLDFDRREILVKRSYCHKVEQLNDYTKGKKPRRVPMNEVVFKLLRERALLPLSAPVMPANYRQLSDSKLKPACRRAGVTVLTWHDLRHTFASHMAMLGVSVFHIKELLGHADLQTTMRYMHLAPGHLSGITDVLLKAKAPISDSVLAAPAK